MREQMFETVQLGVRKSFLPLDWLNFSVDAHADEMLSQIVLDVRARMLKHVTDVTWNDPAYYYPTLWDHIKATWLFRKLRFKARQEKFDQRVEVHHLCPHIGIKDHDAHVRFMVGPRDPWNLEEVFSPR